MTTLNTITMTTVEIAAMTGKRHDNVLRDADRAIELVNKSRASNLRSLCVVVVALRPPSRIQ